MSEEIINLRLPVLASQNVVLFPGQSIPMRVGRALSIQCIENAIKGEDRKILIVAQHQLGEDQNLSSDMLYQVGTVARIEKAVGSSSLGYQIFVKGLERVQVLSYQEENSCLWADIEPLTQIDIDDPQKRSALLSNIKQESLQILQLIPTDTAQLMDLVDAIDDLELLCHMCAEHLDITVDEKQKILEESSLEQRCLLVLEKMHEQKEHLRLQAEIREKVQKRVGKAQRESILREQVRTIQDELGEGGAQSTYREKFAKLSLTDELKKIVNDELSKLESMGSSSPESHVVRNYLDFILALPWTTDPVKDIDLDEARRTLDQEHYGIQSVKQRIIQHLAVMKLRPEKKGSTLLLVGPPGVGKTSIAQSVAKALGRKYHRISLGGVRDESDVRGHRRTYVAAMAGRILQGIKKSGSQNPVMVLDEIDKLAQGNHGDPSAALLEVLDPEQNKGFVDHYLDAPYDLSQVFFVATANSLENIPPALLDRMEVIRLSGYTTAEKFQIAKRHLVQKQLKEHGLQDSFVHIDDAALLEIISRYTREAGVRELSRKISGLARWAAEKIVDRIEIKEEFRIREKDLADALGAPRFELQLAETIVPPGVVTGLAWTPSGGDILFVEASQMPGNGKVMVTGQLGDVMKESAQIAMSLIRSRIPQCVPDLSKRDIHVHFPAGAIPKDGPSAGITMVMALASLFTHKSISPKLAMTGEISLRGSILPVGGIKEKIIAAHRAGITHALIPKANQADLKEIPQDVLDQIDIRLVEKIDDVLLDILDIHVDLDRYRSLLLRGDEGISQDRLSLPSA